MKLREKMNMIVMVLCLSIAIIVNVWEKKDISNLIRFVVAKN